jgi:hypothetical protein
MTNQQLFEKINKIIEREMKRRSAEGKLIRKYNEKNNGVWVMITYRNGNNSKFKSPHLDIKNFVDNMSFEQMRRVCVDAGGKFYALQLKQEGKNPEDVLKKKENNNIKKISNDTK